MFDTNLNLTAVLAKKEVHSKGEFSYPHDLTFDPAGDVHVTDQYNHCAFTEWNISENIWQTWQWTR